MLRRTNLFITPSRFPSSTAATASTVASLLAASPNNNDSNKYSSSSPLLVTATQQHKATARHQHFLEGACSNSASKKSPLRWERLSPPASTSFPAVATLSSSLSLSSSSMTSRFTASFFSSIATTTSSFSIMAKAATQYRFLVDNDSSPRHLKNNDNTKKKQTQGANDEKHNDLAEKLLDLYESAPEVAADGGEGENGTNPNDDGDDRRWSSSLRAGIKTFLERASPPLDPKEFFEKVAQWVETPKKPKNYNGRSLYSDLRTKEQYFKSHNLQPDDEENTFFQDSFFDELETLYDDFLRSQAKTLDEIFEGVASPLYPQLNFPRSFCLPNKNTKDQTTLEEVNWRHKLATDGLSHIPRLKKKNAASAVNQTEEEHEQEYLKFTETNLPVVWQLAPSSNVAQQVILICGASGSGIFILLCFFWNFSLTAEKSVLLFTLLV